MASKVEYEIQGGVARITLNRPSRNNCLDVELLEQWRAGIQDIEEAPVKVVTLTGAGGNFSAGADLSLFRDAVERGDRERIRQFIDGIHNVTLAMERLPVPTLAVIEGYALAGGLEILLACDLRIATTDATIGDQHANYGLVAGGGGTQRLIRQIDTCRANELMYTGRHLSGTKAAEWGLVNRAVPADELEETVRDYEEELARKSRAAADVTKDLMRRGRQLNKEAGLDLERRTVVEYYFSDDAREGFTAFEEGRAPEF